MKKFRVGMGAFSAKVRTNGCNPTEGMVWIPEGSFSMGDSMRDNVFDDERPVHSVSVDDGLHESGGQFPGKWLWVVRHGGKCV